MPLCCKPPPISLKFRNVTHLTERLRDICADTLCKRQLSIGFPRLTRPGPARPPGLRNLFVGRRGRHAAGRPGSTARLGRAGREAPRGPAAKTPRPPHLHVGHEALLDSPAVFIDLFQELKLIIIAATHGGDNSGVNSRIGFEERLPRCSPHWSATVRNSARRRGRVRGRFGGRQATRLETLTVRFSLVELDCPPVFTFWDIYWLFSSRLRLN